MNKAYNQYYDFIIFMFDRHNSKVIKSDLPSHWKTNLYVDKNIILTELQFENNPIRLKYEQSRRILSQKSQ